MAGDGNWQAPSPSMALLDRPIHDLGFDYTLVSPEKITGSLKVTERCCQPFKLMNGGVSGLIAESMASFGGYLASGMQMVVGVQLSTNHIRPVFIGDELEAEATPIHVGKTIQVWEVKTWKKNVSSSKERLLTSNSRVTLMSKQATDGVRGQEVIARKHAAKL